MFASRRAGRLRTTRNTLLTCSRFLGVVLVAAVLVAFSRYWDGRLEKPAVTGAVYGPVASAVFAALSLFAGAFFVGQSRQPAFRWLRAFGAWLLAGFVIMFPLDDRDGVRLERRPS